MNITKELKAHIRNFVSKNLAEFESTDRYCCWVWIDSATSIPKTAKKMGIESYWDETGEKPIFIGCIEPSWDGGCNCESDDTCTHYDMPEPEENIEGITNDIITGMIQRERDEQEKKNTKMKL